MSAVKNDSGISRSAEGEDAVDLLKARYDCRIPFDQDLTRKSSDATDHIVLNLGPDAYVIASHGAYASDALLGLANVGTYRAGSVFVVGGVGFLDLDVLNRIGSVGGVVVVSNGSVEEASVSKRGSAPSQPPKADIGLSIELVSRVRSRFARVPEDEEYLDEAIALLSESRVDGISLADLVRASLATLTADQQQALLTALGECVLETHDPEALMLLIGQLRSKSASCRVGAVLGLDAVMSRDLIPALEEARRNEPIASVADLERRVIVSLGKYGRTST